MKFNNTFIFGFIFLCFSCSKQKDHYAYLFDKIDTQNSGLDFTNTVRENEDFNILEYLYFYNGGGVAIGDINNDQLEDIFLTSNQGQDKLYLNLGGMKFKDVTLESGIIHTNGWSTGVNIVDIDGDGWRDIYVCRLGKYKAYQNDYNRVYINDGKGKFIEKSIEIGLRFSGFSTQCIFFDADMDGDLDAYLLNHSVKDASHFNPSDIRNASDSLAGDKFYENKDGTFHDITQSSGIYHSSIGYGLGVTTSDFNNDGWQDIYVCNDFHENDYLYLNQKNMTFREVCRESFGHTSTFSMGVDCDDVDEDGFIDIFTTDMKPDDELIYKNSGGWENLQIYNFKRSFGYYHQQPKNAFQWNRGVYQDGTPHFSEVSGLLGMDATDWSWSPLIADFNLDGNKDIFITNGINRRPNDLDFVHFISNETGSLGKPDTVLIQSMPEGKQSNKFFSGDGKLNFLATKWEEQSQSLSSGAALGDLDNDGDFDLLINNYNEKVTLLKNNSETKSSTTLILKNNTKNYDAIGAKVIVFDHLKTSYFQIKSVQGFQSSGSKRIIFHSDNQNIDSVLIVWPEGETQLIKNLIVGTRHIITRNSELDILIKPPLFTKESFTALKTIIHHEDDYNDQLKEAWMPYLLSTSGPKIALSKNGLGYMTNAKNNSGVLFEANTGKKLAELDRGLAKAAVDENNASFFDANGDGLEDLYLCLGGNEVKNGGQLLSDQLFLQNNKGKYEVDLKMLPVIPVNTAVAAPFDYDEDGDIDLFVGVLSKPGIYGMSESSYLLENQNNVSFIQKTIDVTEMVFDAKWADIDGDGDVDLIICGHWMPITVFYNEKGKFRREVIRQSEGLWFTLTIDDIDGDGISEIIAGNFGNNHSLKCSPDHPLMLYINDFDKNGQTESLITYVKKGKRFIFPNRDMFVSQLPGKKKSFLKNNDFAGKTIDEIFTANELKGSIIKKCSITSSAVFFKNKKTNVWACHILPPSLQVSSIRAIEKLSENCFAFGGNFWEVDPNIGRQDALPLSVYTFEKNIGWAEGRHFFPLNFDQIRSIKLFKNRIYIASNDMPLKYIHFNPK
ncbi:MAG: VCBS repeat-containing protein [Saprospiraceae bacterium]|nr:VCBS repeat-containing protein [Saprospiraceae bacterium]